MKPSHWTHLTQLARAMQQEGVDGRVAGDFIAEIDAHLADSDADPANSLAPLDHWPARWPDETEPPVAGGSDLTGWQLPPGCSLSWPSWWVSRRRPRAGGPHRGLGLTRGLWRDRCRARHGLGILATRRLDGRSWSPLTGWSAWLILGAVAALAASGSVALEERFLVTVSRLLAIAVEVVGIPLLAAIVASRTTRSGFPTTPST